MAELAPFTDDERATIRAFASGDETKRASAINAYRGVMRRTGKVFRGDPYFEFVGEFDGPCPDYGYRAMMRRLVLESPDASN